MFSNTPRLQETSLLRRASLCGVIISDRSALKISSRGSSTLTSEFSVSEIFVQRLPGSSVTSLRRRRSGGGFCSSPSCCPCKNDVIEGSTRTATCLCHLSLCDDAHFSVSGLGTTLLPCPGSHNHITGERVTWAGPSRTSSPVGSFLLWS